MSIFKKIGAPLVAVALVAVMGVSLLTNQRPAEAAITTVNANTNLAAVLITTNALSGTNTATATTGSLVILEGATAQINAVAGRTLIIAPPSGWGIGTGTNRVGVNGVAAAAPTGGSLGTCTVTLATTPPTCTLTVASNKLVATFSGTNSTVAAAQVAITGFTLVPLNSTAAAGSITIDPASTILGDATATGLTGGTAIGAVLAPTGLRTTGFTSPYTIALFMTTGTANCSTALPPTSIIADGIGALGGNVVTDQTFAADGSLGGALCTLLVDANGQPVSGATMTFSVSSGFVSTGTAKSTTAVTSAAGLATIAYRGGGNIAATDTAIASNATLSVVATLSIGLTAPAGGTASKVIVGSAQNQSVAASITNTSPGYVAPQIGTMSYVQVQDAAALGVDGQVVLITTDRGALVDGMNVACVGQVSKSITPTTATEAQVLGGLATPGTIAFTICANQLDAPGKATITAQNISTSMANATLTITSAGAPAKITATATGNTISAKVVDAGGNAVSDGTVVRFTISANAGAVSTACSSTSNGVASTVVALIAATGTVIVSTDYSETGATVPGCAVAAAGNQTSQIVVASGSQSIAASVAVPGGTSSAGGTPAATPAPAAGAGSFATPPVFSASKLAQVVFNGGTVVQLDAAVTGVTGTGAWAQDAKGAFALYIVGGGFVNDGFKAAFPTGFAGVTALTVVGK